MKTEEDPVISRQIVKWTSKAKKNTTVTEVNEEREYLRRERKKDWEREREHERDRDREVERDT